MLYSDIEGNVLNLCLFKDGRYQKIDLIENPTHTKGNRTYVKLYAPQVVKSLDCSECGFGLTVQDLYTGYCPLCGTWFLVIDDLVFTADRVYVGIWDTIWEDIYYMPPPAITGEEGGGIYGGQNATYTYSGTSWTLDLHSYQKLKPTLDLLKRDTMSNKLLIVLSLKDLNFKYDPTILPLAIFSQPNIITWNSSNLMPPLELIHELVHACQYYNLTSVPANKLNREIEAFVALYIYAINNNITDQLYGPVSNWTSAFNPYLNDSSDSNYEIMIEFVKSLNSVYETFSESKDSRNLNNITNIFVYKK